MEKHENKIKKWIMKMDDFAIKKSLDSFSYIARNHYWLNIAMILFIFIAPVLVFIVPIIINIAYETPATETWLAMNWTAKDALGYYGSILGAVATITAVIMTIKFTVDNQKEERKKEARPYLIADFLNCSDITRDWLSRANVFINISRNKIESDYLVSKDLSELSYYNDMANELPKDLTGENKALYKYRELLADFKSEKCFAICRIENIGANNAVFLKIQNRDSESPPSMYVTVDRPLYIGMTLNQDLLYENCTETPVDINFEYTDIYSSTVYHQGIHIILSREENDSLRCKTSTYFVMTPPREIKK